MWISLYSIGWNSDHLTARMLFQHPVSQSGCPRFLWVPKSTFFKNLVLLGKGKGAGSELRVDFISSSFAETHPRKEFRFSKHVCLFTHTLCKTHTNHPLSPHFGHLEVNRFNSTRTREQARTEEPELKATCMGRFRKEDSRGKYSWNLSHQQKKKKHF